MPYCAQCGKLITEEILRRNNGECNECFQESMTAVSKINLSSTQSSVSKLVQCSYCQTLTDVRCQTCRKPLCHTHLHTDANGKILCKECDEDNTGLCCFIGCVGMVFLFLILAVMGGF